MSSISQSGEATAAASPSEDELFEVLSNRRRRYAVHALKSEDAPAEIGELAEQVAAWEYDIDVGQVSYDERKRVYTALQQSHLPKMDDAGVVEFDKDRGLVEPTEAMDDVEVYMDIVQGNELPWSEYYLGLSGSAAALMIAVWASIWPFTMLPNIAWGIAVVAAFLVSAVVHTYYARGRRIGETEQPPDVLG